jgi:mono/diheme cytochrome c family protein
MCRSIRLVTLLAVLFLIAGCTSDDSATDEPTTAVSTEATVTTAAPTTTQTAAVGDPERGRQIWEDGGDVLEGGGCSGCHSLDGSERTKPAVLTAPSWQGISGSAGDRVPGLSGEQYLRESIVDPAAYIVEGYSDYMLKGYRFLLSEEDIDNLVVFLLTQ